MTQPKTFFIFTLLLFFSSCNTDKFNGEWTYSDKVLLTFMDENEYHWKMTYDNINFWGKYFIQPENDSLILTTQWDFSLRFKFQFVNNSLVLWSEKSSVGETKGHIDEIFAFSKRGNDKPRMSDDSEKEIFKLPLNFIGDIFINYHQKGAGNNLVDRQKNRIISVTDRGFVKTEFKEQILPYAFGLFEFESLNKRYPFFIQDLMTSTEINRLNPDSVYVCVYGYNQIGRKEINKLYGEKITGNVLMLKVDTLKNIIVVR